MLIERFVISRQWATFPHKNINFSPQLLEKLLRSDEELSERLARFGGFHVVSHLLKPLEHQIALVLRGLRRVLNWTFIMPRDVSLSDSRCNFSINFSFYDCLLVIFKTGTYVIRRPKDFHLSAQFRAPLKPLGAMYIAVKYWGFCRTLNWAPWCREAPASR